METNTRMIDITPTWSAIGEIYIRLAESNEQKAIRGMRDEIRKAFAIASAAVAMSKEFDDAQKQRFQQLLGQHIEQDADGDEARVVKEMEDAAREFGVPYSPVLLIADESGLLTLPNGDLLICRYDEGDCDTINAAEPDLNNLRRALFDARECGEIPSDCSIVMLPFGGTFDIDAH